jgi:oligopeptide transport system ATP-binding protein
MIATTLALEPKLLIADEPTTALDVTMQAQVLEVMADVQRELGLSIVLITHDLGVVAGYSDRVMVMYGGRVVEIGTREDIFYRPRHAYTAALLGSMPRLDTPVHDDLISIKGYPPDLASVQVGCAFEPRCPIGNGDALCSSEQPPLIQLGEGRIAACHHSDLVEGMRA